MRRYLTGSTCVVNLFAKGILVTGSFPAKLIAARHAKFATNTEPSSSGTVLVLWYF